MWTSMVKSILFFAIWMAYPDSKVHGANMGPIWGWQDPAGGPHVGHVNLAIWVVSQSILVWAPKESLKM